MDFSLASVSASRNILRCARCGVALMLLSIAATAVAQSYPVRPIRVLTPNAPGGGLDVVARMTAPAPAVPSPWKLPRVQRPMAIRSRSSA
jgi:hypothetical protein